MTTDRVMAIAGAGHVGGRAAQVLREAGWRGGIALIGAERHWPYERPPLSKGLLTGQRSASQCQLRAPEAWREDSVEHIVATVTQIDPSAHEVALSNGRRIAYHALLLATGGHARRLALPGTGADQVLTLRTLDDALTLAPRLTPGAHIVLIGGGFIGLEVAASARSHDCRVTVLEAAPRLLGRAVPESIAAHVHALHERHDVRIAVGKRPVALDRMRDGTLAVTLDDGERLIANTVVAGIGIDPADELARAAGLAVDRGVVVNECLETSTAGIFAAGDVAAFPSRLSGRLIRQETWHNAQTQARVAALNMLGRGEIYRDLPWFWSDQYDYQLQVAGEPMLGERAVSRLLADGAEIHFYLDTTNRLVAASGFGHGSAFIKDMRLARMLVERGVPAEPAVLADAKTKLKDLLQLPAQANG